jgi:hypothetical protein
MNRLKFSAKKELKKIKSITAALPEDLQKITEGLVADACFMAEQLEILRCHLEENGWSEEYKNGANQFGKKSSVEAQAYLQMQKSYAAVIKQLTDLIPKQETSKAGEEILSFIGGSRSPRK